MSEFKVGRSCPRISMLSPSASAIAMKLRNPLPSPLSTRHLNVLHICRANAELSQVPLLSFRRCSSHGESPHAGGVLSTRRNSECGGNKAVCRAQGRERTGVMLVSERGKVVVLLALVLLLCNADRVVMSVAVVPLATKYGWSSAFLGIVQSSFLWGYVISSMVGGNLADHYGGKWLMACAATVWSMATFLTPWAASHSPGMLLAVRAIFGLAEGVAFPTMSTLLSRWFPAHERATALALSMGGFHIGNVLSFLASPIIISHAGIDGAFTFFSCLGYFWACTWVLSICNNPRDSPTITKAELQLIQAGSCVSKDHSKCPSISDLFSKVQVWAILVANTVNNWGYFLLLSWMPMYFKSVYSVDLKQAAWFSAVPYAAMALAGYIAGACADFMIKSGIPIGLVRKIMQSVGFMGPALSLLYLRFAQTPDVAAILMTIALSLSSCTQAGYMCNVQDIAPKYAGSLHGITNGVGILAATISTAGAGYCVHWFGSMQAFLTLTAMLYFSATLFYNMYATGEQIFY